MTMDHNPWIECFLGGEFIFETRFLLYSLGYILLSFIGSWCHRSYHAAVRANPDKPPSTSSVKALIASRPTVIAATVHSVATAVIAVGVLVLYYNNLNNPDNSTPWLYQGTTNLIHVWQRVGLPISISYFVTDCYFYCLPRKDVLIFIHHCIMCFCHYPAGHDSGAKIAGAGDLEWVTWLSIVGYTSEVSTAMMNYRWYLINTLEENWIGFGIVNVVVVASWAGRVLIFTYLLVAEIYPRMPMYVEHQQMVTFGVMVFGHASIGLLSAYWCVVMCRGGLKSLFVFKKKRPRVLNPQQGFSFAEEVGGKNGDEGAIKPLGSPLQIIEEEADAYKDGSIFTEGQTKTRHSKKTL
ncbi:hypothetical protein ACHAWF_004806 [Thalassiosira exigua]